MDGKRRMLITSTAQFGEPRCRDSTALLYDGMLGVLAIVNFLRRENKPLDTSWVEERRQGAKGENMDEPFLISWVAL